MPYRKRLQNRYEFSLHAAPGLVLPTDCHRSAQIAASLPDQMEEESKRAHQEGEEGGESTGQEPPVLPMDSTAAGSASGGGLREQTDVWHVSSLPEHKTFFSLDVSRACFLA